MGQPRPRRPSSLITMSCASRTDFRIRRELRRYEMPVASKSIIERFGRRPSTPHTRKPSWTAQPIRGRDLEDSSYPKRKNPNASVLGMGSDFIDRAPSAKIREYAKSTPEKAAVRKFRESDIVTIVLRHARSSLYSVGSGAAC